MNIMNTLAECAIALLVLPVAVLYNLRAIILIRVAA